MIFCEISGEYTDVSDLSKKEPVPQRAYLSSGLVGDGPFIHTRRRRMVKDGAGGRAVRRRDGPDSDGLIRVPFAAGGQGYAVQFIISLVGDEVVVWEEGEFH